MRMPKVLLVDANPDTRASLAKALAEGGYDAVTAPNGSLAVSMLEAERPDVIMSYAQVQDMDGHELFTLVRKDPTTMDTPFLLLAGRNRPVALAAAEAGVDVILMGDLPPGVVVGRVRNMLKPDAGADMPAPSVLRRNDAVKPAESRWTSRQRAASGTPGAATAAFQGSLDVMDLIEVTQAVALGGKTGRLVVSLTTGEGVILFEGGRIVHASFSGKTGVSAFTAIMATSQRDADARFHFSRIDRAELADGPRTISCSVEQLLLSIAVEIDEGDLEAAPLEETSPAQRVDT